MKKYSELLRDPRWQKRRLEILSRDSWTCQACRSTTKTLAVHHVVYEDGIPPWGYPDAYLVTLCEDCHNLEYQREEAESQFTTFLRFVFHAKQFEEFVESFMSEPFLTADTKTRKRMLSLVQLILLCPEYVEPTIKFLRGFEEKAP